MATLKNVTTQAAAVVANIKKVVAKEDLNMAAQNATQAFATDLGNKVAENIMAAKAKEEKDMLIEELKGMSRDALRGLAKGKIKGYSKLNKDQLIEALAIGATKVETSTMIPAADVIKELKEAGVDAVKANIPVVGKKEEKDMKEKEVKRIVSGLIIAWGYQTKHDVLGDGKVLFFRPKKKELQGNMIASDSRLSRVTGDLLEMMFGKVEGEEFTKRVNDAYELMIRNNLCHRSQDGHIHLSEAENNKMVEWYTKFCQDESLNMKGFVADYIAFAKGQAAQFNAKKAVTAKRVDGKQQQGKIYNAKLIGTMVNADGTPCRIYVEQ